MYFIVHIETYPNLHQVVYDDFWFKSYGWYKGDVGDPDQRRATHWF